jgi:hypothetical protein
MKGLIPGTIVLAMAQAAAGLCASPASGPTRRFALVVGANRGAADRVPLRYAVADAQRFAEVVTQMGGVLPADRIDLHDPSRKALLEALVRTGTRAASARESASRVEVIFYFSGHADDQGLMLGREMVPYRELRTAVSAMGADVGITILDACASGAITRLKGGSAHPAFLTEAGSAIQGYAFLTSSSENETAQESDRLRGSFFTHALVSGLRGAADATGDGRVTLNEAYQFAFHETLVQTAPTEGGAQHPSYDIRMAGTGEVVMTDVRQTSSSLVLGEELEGRFVVLSAQRRLVAELYKPAGRKVELGLDAGDYEVFFEQEKQRLTSKVSLAEGVHKELLRAELKEAPRSATRSRGGSELSGDDDVLDGQLRVQAGTIELEGSRFTFLYWNNRQLAFEFGFGTPAFAGSTDVLLGARFYPPVRSLVRPYVGLALGRLEVAESSGTEFLYTHGVLGGEFKVGFDVLLGRRVSLHLEGRGDFAQGGHRRFSPAFGLGWSFGGR